MGKVRNNADKEARERQSGKASKYKEAEDAARKTQQNSADDLEILFSMGSRSSSVPKSQAMTSDSMFDAERSGRGKADTVDKKVSGFSSGMSRLLLEIWLMTFPHYFGDASLFGEFEKLVIKVKKDEKPDWDVDRGHRIAIVHLYAQATVVANMNKCDLQAQYEQEERSERIAEQMDVVTKHWAAETERNLRALSSSLQQGSAQV